MKTKSPNDENGGRENKRVFYILIRYALLLVIGIWFFELFYTIFSPLTIQLVALLMKQTYGNVYVIKTTIVFNTVLLDIIKACVAGAAYYLLLILNLITPMPFRKRIPSIFFVFLLFLTLNVLRIFVSAIFFINSLRLFELTHLLFWYFLSGVIVFFVWFIEIKTFKIRGFPVYSDVEFLLRVMRRGKE